MEIKKISATWKQINYLEILFNDLGFTSEQKRVKLMADFKVEHIADLSKLEASLLIEELKSYKDD